MVPAPSFSHQYFALELAVALRKIAKARDLVVVNKVGLMNPSRDDDSDYRQPDVAVVDLAHASRRGVEGRAELVVEVLSPRDESREKLEFYAMCEVQEVWLVDPQTRAFEVYSLRGRDYFVVGPDRDGVVHAPVLAVALSVVDGPKLRIAWSDRSEDV